LSRVRRRNKSYPRGTVTIEDLADKAQGVGHDSTGKTVFVRDALPGERVEYQPRRRKPNYDQADLIRVLDPSPDRVEPRCAHFGVCGGCALQHASLAAQSQYKQSQVLDALERIGAVCPQAVNPPITGPGWYYRRRARLGVKYVPKKGGTLVGFRERSSSFLAQLERCHTLVPDVGERLTEMARLIDGLSIREHIPQIEVAAGDNVTALVFRVLEPPSDSDQARLLEFSRRFGFAIYLQPGDEGTIKPLLDSPSLYYDLPNHDARLFFAPSDFVQINGQVNARLVDVIIEALEIRPEDDVLELFAGLGNLSVPLARRAHSVTAIEGEAALVERARTNASVNSVDNVRHFHANLFVPGDEPEWAGCYDHVVIDPPRAGAAEVLSLVASTGARRVVYCSCHPATLARDAGVLEHIHGYRLSRLVVADMFPHTAHVESVAVFDLDRSSVSHGKRLQA